MTDPAHNIRAAFRYVTLGLMAWEDPPPPECPLCGRWPNGAHAAGCHLYRRLEALPDPALRLPDADKQTHYGHAEYVDPFDVAADWEERA